MIYFNIAEWHCSTLYDLDQSSGLFLEKTTRLVNICHSRMHLSSVLIMSRSTCSTLLNIFYRHENRYKIVQNVSQLQRLWATFPQSNFELQHQINTLFQSIIADPSRVCLESAKYSSDIACHTSDTIWI